MLNLNTKQAIDRLKTTRLFVLDMDGTIYLGEKIFEDALKFVHRVRADGKKIAFFTNNASRSADYYYEKLERMGFDPQPGEVLTAGDVTAAYLTTHRKGEPVYLVGTPSLEQSFIEKGIKLSSDAKIVVVSFDTTVTYEKLETACTLIRNGAEFLSTHPDFNCPTEHGFIPDSGAICALVTASTGKEPRYFGKPCADAAQMIAEMTGTPASETAMAGDRLYTDIPFGKNNGMLSILVLTGEAKVEDVTVENQPHLCLDKIGDVYRYLAE